MRLERVAFAQRLVIVVSIVVLLVVATAFGVMRVSADAATAVILATVTGFCAGYLIHRVTHP